MILMLLMVLAMLEASLSSIIDVKTGKIPNKWNLFLFSLNSVVALLEAPCPLIIVRVVASIPLALSFYGLGFGGGDCKLIIAISPLLSPFDLGMVLLVACIIGLSRGKGNFHSCYFALSFAIALFPKLIKNLGIIQFSHLLGWRALVIHLSLQNRIGPTT